MLLKLQTVPHNIRMNAVQGTFLLCDRLTIPLPFLKSPYYCHPECGKVGTHPPHYLPPESPIFAECHHGYHQASCMLHGHNITRHNVWADHLAAVIRKAWKADAFTTHMLRTEGESRKQVDIHVEYPDQPERWATAFDPTICCPYLRNYVNKPVASVIGDRAQQKHTKHYNACRLNRREFIPIVVLTGGGIGSKLEVRGSPDTDRFWRYWDEMWDHARVAARAEGTPDYEISLRKQYAEAEMHAILARRTTASIQHLAYPSTYDDSSGRRTNPQNYRRTPSNDADEAGPP